MPTTAVADTSMVRASSTAGVRSGEGVDSKEKIASAESPEVEAEKDVVFSGSVDNGDASGDERKRDARVVETSALDINNDEQIKGSGIPALGQEMSDWLRAAEAATAQVLVI